MHPITETVRVEVDEHGNVIRIFRVLREAIQLASEHPERVQTRRRREAVEEIRREIYKRSNGRCELCGNIITWLSMHMHEKISRGKGGEISLENSIAIDYGCHMGRTDSEHGDRRWGGKADG